MQIRSSEIYGLDATDDAAPPRWMVLLVFTLAIVSILLAVACVLGTETVLSNGPASHFDKVKPLSTKLTPTPIESAPVDPAAPQTFAPLTPEQALAINASIPVSSAPNPAAQPFKLAAIDPVDQLRAQTCLTMAVYYEAANQGVAGQSAVAQVVLNRLRNPRFPKTVCGVVFQGSTLPTGCQFTFTCDGSLNRTPDPVEWKQASQVAERALNGYVEPSVGEATHYHTVWVVPYWQSTVEKVAQIGAHIFYRWSGPLGQPHAFGFAYTGAELLPSNVRGFDPAPEPGVSYETVTPVVAERDSPPPRAVLAASVAASSAVQRTPVAMLTPALPPRLETRPAGLVIANPQGVPEPNHHLAMPTSW
jgi:spore germination cell wall hydrolase CwlJ-like protein